MSRIKSIDFPRPPAGWPYHNAYPAEGQTKGVGRRYSAFRIPHSEFSPSPLTPRHPPEKGELLALQGPHGNNIKKHARNDPASQQFEFLQDMAARLPEGVPADPPADEPHDKRRRDDLEQ